MVRNTHADDAGGKKRPTQPLTLVTKSKPKSSKNGKHRLLSQPKELANGEDERFNKVFTDPRFRSVPKFERRIKLDDRFRSMLTDDKFKVMQFVDKRGRPSGLSHSSELDRLYVAETNENAEKLGKPNTTKHAKKNPGDNVDEQNSDADSADGLDYARGFGNVESSSSEDESEAEPLPDTSERVRRMQNGKSSNDQVLFGEDGVDHDEQEEDNESQWISPDADAERSSETTHRLALLNQDWTRLTAKDLFVLFSSIVSSGATSSSDTDEKQDSGAVLSVKVYPSQFGLERMAEEAMRGPKELRDLAERQAALAKRKKPKQTDDDDVLLEGDDDDDMNSLTKEQKELAAQKIREYQVNRLKYFYAVIECDSADTANSIYEYCDGIEFEVSGCRLDLRFVADSTTFDDTTDQLKDVFSSSMPIESDYEPKTFITQALQQSKVQCTWDDEQTERKEKLRAVRDVEDERDLDEFCGDDGLDDLLASGTSSEDEEEDVADEEEPETLPVRTNKSRLREYQQMLTELNAEDADNKNDDELDGKRRRDKFALSKQPYKQLDKKGISHAFGAISDDDDDFDDDAAATNGKLSKQKKRSGKKRDDDDAGDSDVDMELTWQPMQNFGDGADENGGDDDDAESKQKRAERQRKMAQRSLEKARQKIRQRKRGGAVDDDSTDDDDDVKDGLDYILERVDKKKPSTSQENRGKTKRPKNATDFEVESRKEFDINADDPRFSAVFTSSEYNIDVSDPKFKPTKGMHKLVSKKLNTTREERMKQQPFASREKSLFGKQAQKTSLTSGRDLADNNVKSGGDKDDETKMLIKRLKKATSKPSGMLRR